MLLEAVTKAGIRPSKSLYRLGAAVTSTFMNLDTSGLTAHDCLNALARLFEPSGRNQMGQTT